MWDYTNDEALAQYERNFQKMLVNNMESVIKIFFRGVSVLRVKTQQSEKEARRSPKKFSRKSDNGEFHCCLSDLERLGIAATRVRGDTKVKQFHAGQIFEYLKSNIKLNQNQCLLVVTNADLYPKDGWTFVFGMTK